MNVKKLDSLKEPLEINLQLVATEMDTSAKYLRVMSKSFMEDSIEMERFEKIIKDIEEGDGVELTALDDNTILYEFEEEAVTVHTNLGVKYLIFDSKVKGKIERRMNRREE